MFFPCLQLLPNDACFSPEYCKPQLDRYSNRRVNLIQQQHTFAHLAARFPNSLSLSLSLCRYYYTTMQHFLGELVAHSEQTKKPVVVACFVSCSPCVVLYFILASRTFTCFRFSRFAFIIRSVWFVLQIGLESLIKQIYVCLREREIERERLWNSERGVAVRLFLGAFCVGHSWAPKRPGQHHHHDFSTCTICHVHGVLRSSPHNDDPLTLLYDPKLIAIATLRVAQQVRYK